MIHKTTRSILSVLLAVLLLVTSTPLTPAFAGGGEAVPPQSESGEGRAPTGSGTKENPYQIATANDLREFAQRVNNGQIRADADAVLTDDIDLSEICGENIGGQSVSWTPIGSISRPYSGTFNGAGHTISGLYINDSTYQGLFGYVDTGGTVQDLSVSGSVSGSYNVGGVVGYNRGSVEDCDFTGSVSGNNYVGGVVGYNGGTVENCYNIGEVSGNYVGGVVGYNGANVENCYNTGSGTVKGNNYVGGVVGWNSSGGGVTNCYNTGSVNGSGNSVGGVVGDNSGPVKNCYNTGSVENSYNTGTVTGTDDYVGGVVGYNISSGTVENCYNTGSVSGNSYVGGVVGWNASGTVTNCYNTGAVNSSGNYVGGVAGYNSGSNGTVENCYNTGTVSDGTTSGGVVGQNSGSVTNCYFLTGTAEKGIGNEADATGATVVTSLNVQDQFKGWDFIDTWRISQSLKCPVLQANAEDNALSGTGKQEDPYKIYRAIDLKNFRDLVNDANGQVKDSDAHAKLMNDINLNGNAANQWTPIGTNIGNPYRGTFNGAGHTIKGLYIDSDADYQGLFGYVSGSGKVQNLSVSGSVKGDDYVGGVVGRNNSNGTVTNCTNTGNVSGPDSVNGSADSSNVGGVVGDNLGSVENCYNTGSVSGDWYVGGVVGYNDRGTVENCYNIGEVSGNNSVGGVVGRNLGGTVENCYNTGSVSGPGNRVGGVVGYNSGSSTVTGCYFLQTETVNTKLQGIGENDGSGDATATAKDDTAFHSGEVAWLLQNGQKAAGEEDPIPQVWGQSNLTATTSLPSLVALDKNENAKPVYKVAFMNDSEEHDAKYANSGMTVTIPAAPSREGHTFTGWSDGTSTYQAGAKVEITSDTKFTAQWTKDTVNYTVTVTASPAEGGTVNGGGTFAEGTQVTVTATANDGYTFVAWQENSTKIEGAGASYTFTVNDNCTLTAIFEKEPDPTPTPTPTPDPEPSGPSTDGSSGWDDIRDELENAENGDQITIDMGDETKVPAEIFESLAGKDVEISFDLGDVQWSVNGADIPTDTDFTDLDLGASLDTHGIPVNVINTITGEVGTVQITLAHDGEFGFTMTLTAPLGKENAGYWANLYHYDEDAEALNFEAAAKIDEDGSVTIPFSHASQYAIVIDTHSHAAVDVSDLFIDIARDAWYKDAVQYAYDNGLMTGVSATEFAPEQTTTRAMIVSILARLEGVTTAEAAGFADVDDEWYATAVNWAANVGVVNGYEDNTFRPNTAITREQLAAILMNYAAYKGYDVSARADLSHYSDADSISSWANDVLLWAVAEGLLTGVTDDTIAPQAHATRAQVAAILQRFLSE